MSLIVLIAKSSFFFPRVLNENSVKILTKNSGFFNRRLVIFTGNLTFLPILT